MTKEVIAIILCCLTLVASLVVFFYSVIDLKIKERGLMDYMQSHDLKWDEYSRTVKRVDESIDGILDHLEKVLAHDKSVLADMRNLTLETQHVNAIAEALIKEIRNGDDRVRQRSDDQAE